MRMFLKLIKLNLNVNFGISALKYRFFKEKKKRWEPLLILFAIVVGFIPLLSVYSLFLLGIFAAGNYLKPPVPEMVITIAFLIGQLVVFVFSIFYIMSAFYFSKDMSILVPLPLKPYQVLGSKFVVVMVNEYLTTIPLLLPAIIIFGIGMSKGIGYWFKSIVLILLSPVIPLIIGALFVLILMRFVNLRKSKDLFAILGGLMGLFFGIGVNLFFQKMAGVNKDEILRNIANQSGIIELIGRKFPPSIWATYGLADNGAKGIGYFSLFVAVSVVLFLVLLWLGNTIFYKGLLSGQETTRRKRVLTEQEASKRYGKKSSPAAAIFLREWKLLLRTPVYVLNGLAGSIVGPIIIVMVLVVQKRTEETRQLMEIIKKPEFAVYAVLGGLGFMLFTAGMNIVASTAVSREGQAFWISKMIPVPPHQQVLGKLMHAMSISIIGILTTAVVLILFFGLPIYKIILITLIACMGAFLLNILSLLVDVIHPKLVWANPQEAMKQNMNGLFGILITLVIILILGGISVPLVLVGAGEWIIYACLSGFIITASIPSYAGLLAAAKGSYRKIEM